MSFLLCQNLGVQDAAQQEGCNPQQWRKQPRKAQRCLSNTEISVMAEAHVLAWRRRTASHLLSHCLSAHPRASPGHGSLDQGLARPLTRLARQVQQLGVTAVSDGNQRRHLFSMAPTPGEHVTAQTSLCLSWTCQTQLGGFIRISCSGKAKFS